MANLELLHREPLPLDADIEVHDPAGCLDHDLLAAELDLREASRVAIEVTVAARGDTRVVRIGLRSGGTELGVSEERFEESDCPNMPVVVALKVKSLIAGIPPWRLDPPPFLAGVELPLGVSVGAGEPWDVRGELGARAILDPARLRRDSFDPERFRILMGAQGTVGTAFEVGSGSARMAEALGLVGAAIGADWERGIRFEAGGFGGVVYAWGEAGLAGAQLSPTTGAWVGATYPLDDWLRAGFAARVYGTRLGVCENNGASAPSCAGGDIVSEPWVRVEARLVPTWPGAAEKKEAR